ncbi:MAG TPA: glutaredoxin domain-containing protein [Candidatus Dojkabacteria bacterium]|nr:glutaredoxin domain-containing protein [Candidatus Dojkabacteria bacterium]
MKKLILAVIFSFAILVTSITMVSAADTKYKLYIRQGCPHCAKVEAFLQENNLEDKVQYIETYNNDTNQKAMEADFNKYGVTDTAQMGVPFLVVDDKTYYVGDTPIIKFFADKYNIDISKLTQYQSSSSDILFLGLGGLAIIAIVGYGIYSSMKKK